MKRFILFSVLLLTPCLTLAQGFGGSAPSWLRLLSESGGTLTLSGDMVATKFSATAASGSVALKGNNGAKFCPGAETACFTSNGTTIMSQYMAATSVSVGTLSGNGITIATTTGTGIVSSASANGLRLKASLSDGASRYGFEFDTTNALSSADGLMLFSNGGTPIAEIGNTGEYAMDGDDQTGTPGAATINKPRMRVAVAAAASSVVITNSLVTATTPVYCQAQAADATCTQVANVVPGAGSFTVNMNAACTGNTAVACDVAPMF